MFCLTGVMAEERGATLYATDERYREQMIAEHPNNNNYNNNNNKLVTVRIAIHACNTL